ncbi:YidC/Oxa1 family membrane protein insertase [Streptomyces polyrhachis]|uniref:Membrane protein insertase YidC n=1 Tax=Streptomyces polyrhachis TaxID=1282885 RepID=A0ABW2GCN2_9ACTN
MFDALSSVLSALADVLDPLFGGAATAAAVIVFTLCVRLALHPLARATARGHKTREALSPQLAELQRKHRKNPEKLQKATMELYRESGSSPLAGCGPMLLQLPVFMVMYRLFSGHDHELLDHTLLGAPLGGRWSDALADGGVFGPHGLVYLGLFAVVAAGATWSFLHSRRLAAAAAARREAAGVAGNAAEQLPGMAGMARWMPLLSFGTLLSAAVVPLAAALYLATTTLWSVAERTLLHRTISTAPAPAKAAASVPAPAKATTAAPAKAGAKARTKATTPAPAEARAEARTKATAPAAKAGTRARTAAGRGNAARAASPRPAKKGRA